MMKINPMLATEAQANLVADSINAQEGFLPEGQKAFVLDSSDDFIGNGASVDPGPDNGPDSKVFTINFLGTDGEPHKEFAGALYEALVNFPPKSDPSYSDYWKTVVNPAGSRVYPSVWALLGPGTIGRKSIY